MRETHMLSGALKTQISAGQKALGVLMTYDFWPGNLEIAKREGVDFVVVDREHGQADLSRIEELCRVGRLLDLPTLVRPSWAEFGEIKRVMDLGAGGLMVPWVESHEQVHAVRDGAFTPPNGRRGVGGPGVFAARGIDTKSWLEMEESLFVMLQIESPAGIQVAKEVAAPDWVDALIPGPFDLAHNMGLLDQFLAAPEHIEALLSIKQAASTVGKPCGMVVPDGRSARQWFSRGFDFAIINCFMGHMTRGLRANLQEALEQGDGSAVEGGNPPF
jgi:2-keto-3-deoxy-L-rhamnonate aldolase RhmA